VTSAKPLSEIIDPSWARALAPVEPTVHEIGERLRQAARPAGSVMRECAQEDGAEGAALRAQAADAIIIMGGEDVHPSLYGASQGYEHHPTIKAPVAV